MDKNESFQQYTKLSDSLKKILDNELMEFDKNNQYIETPMAILCAITKVFHDVCLTTMWLGIDKPNKENIYNTIVKNFDNLKEILKKQIDETKH